MDGVDLDIRAGRSARPGRRVGIGQERHRAERAAARFPIRRAASSPARSASRAATCSKLSWDEIRKIRGSEISMVFQEPMTSLNPVFTIGMQVTEVILQHEPVSQGGGASPRGRHADRSRASRTRRARMKQYPHHLSGGMRQRVMIAMALVLQPVAAHRRRADDGARRHDPGADPRPDAGDEGAARRTPRSC